MIVVECLCENGSAYVHSGCIFEASLMTILWLTDCKNEGFPYFWHKLLLLFDRNKNSAWIQTLMSKSNFLNNTGVLQQLIIVYAWKWKSNQYKKGKVTNKVMWVIKWESVNTDFREHGCRLLWFHMLASSFHYLQLDFLRIN